jgi:hypothetical protein
VKIGSEVAEAWEGNMNRREFIKTGIAAGAAMALPDFDLFAQGTQLIQKKFRRVAR